MQLVLKEKVKWTRRKIKCEGEKERITRVNKRHNSSEGEQKRLRGGIKRCNWYEGVKLNVLGGKINM